MTRHKKLIEQITSLESSISQTPVKAKNARKFELDSNFAFQCGEMSRVIDKMLPIVNEYANFVGHGEIYLKCVNALETYRDFQENRLAFVSGKDFPGIEG